MAPDTFAISSLKNRNRAARHGRQPRSVGVDEDWEDGEDMGPEEDYESEESEEARASDEGSGDEEGSWLEGRFPRCVLQSGTGDHHGLMAVRKLSAWNGHSAVRRLRARC